MSFCFVLIWNFCIYNNVQLAKIHSLLYKMSMKWVDDMRSPSCVAYMLHYVSSHV